MDKRTRQGEFNHRLTSLGTQRVPGEITYDPVVVEVEEFVKTIAESRSPATSVLGVHPHQL